jgi:hypothetical protein
VNRSFANFHSLIYPYSVTTLEKGELDAIRLPFSTGVPLNSHNRNNRNLKAKLGRLYHSLLHDLGTVREASVTSYPMSPQILIQSRVGNSSGPPVVRHVILAVGIHDHRIQNSHSKL